MRGTEILSWPSEGSNAGRQGAGKLAEREEGRRSGAAPALAIAESGCESPR